MKTKILFGIFAVSALMFTASCNDDDEYSPATGELISSVSTGATDVTANSATLHGTVSGDISNLSANSYSVGFYYGDSQDNLSDRILGEVSSNEIKAVLSGLTKGQTIYYQAFVTLQNKVTYKGEVKSLTTSDASAVTSDAKDITYYSAVLNGTLSGNGDGSTAGFVISCDERKVRSGLAVEGSVEGNAVSLKKLGLLPSKTYYYATYLNLGNDSVFGETKSFTTESFEIQKDDIVDLGLSVKWLKYNIGAQKESDLGGLYAFGDLDGCNRSTSVSDYGVNADIVETENDLARATFGDFAKMPTADQLEELFTLCQKEWAEVDGVSGLKLTGPNGNSIFLPAAGYREGNSVSGESEIGMYYSGNIKNSNFASAYSFTQSSNSLTVAPLFRALSIRPCSKGYGFNAKLTCFSNAESDAEDAWASASEFIVPEAGKSFTLTFSTTYPRSRGSVYVIDIENFAAKYPNSCVLVESIKKDGTDLKFDASRFFYGEIGDKGNYRIELANIWGKGGSNNKVADNPFTAAGGETADNGPVELAFNETFEVTFKVVSLESNGAGEYPIKFITINPEWKGDWNYEIGKSVVVKFEDNKYFVTDESSVVDFTFQNADVDYSAGSIMTFVQIDNFPFMQPNITFNSISIDGTPLDGYDKAKIINSSDGDNYRLELWNMYGSTSSKGCAFGTATNGVISELGFTSSMAINLTINSLFSAVK
mgnify:CR=1 FL=1